jgi:hypothetical protein
MQGNWALLQIWKAEWMDQGELGMAWGDALGLIHWNLATAFLVVLVHQELAVRQVLVGNDQDGQPERDSVKGCEEELLSVRKE